MNLPPVNSLCAASDYFLEDSFHLVLDWNHLSYGRFVIYFILLALSTPSVLNKRS